MHKRTTGAFAAALSLGLLFGAGGASAQITDGRFEKKTREVLADLQIPDSEVESIKISVIRGKEDRGPEIRGAESFVRLTSCSGQLVVFMTRSAFVREAYTRGDCSIPGLKSY